MTENKQGPPYAKTYVPEAEKGDIPYLTRAMSWVGGKLNIKSRDQKYKDVDQFEEFMKYVRIVAQNQVELGARNASECIEVNYGDGGDENLFKKDDEGNVVMRIKTDDVKVNLEAKLHDYK